MRHCGHDRHEKGMRLGGTLSHKMGLMSMLTVAAVILFSCCCAQAQGFDVLGIKSEAWNAMVSIRTRHFNFQGVGVVRGRGRKAIKHDADSHACSRMKLGERG